MYHSVLLPVYKRNKSQIGKLMEMCEDKLEEVDKMAQSKIDESLNKMK